MSRYNLALQRLYNAFNNKQKRKFSFFKRAVERRTGKTIDPLPCQKNFLQEVAEVFSVGGETFYSSKICAGCFPLESKTSKDDNKIYGCALVRERLLYSSTPVEVGQIIKAEGPPGEKVSMTKFINNKLKLAKPKTPHRNYVLDANEGVEDV